MCARNPLYPMDSSNLTSSEIPAALSQLLSRQATTTLQQLAALRDALDAAARAVSAAPSRIEQDVHELIGRITAGADAEVRRIREEAHAAIEASRAELRARVAEHERVAAALARTEAERALLRSELETAHGRIESSEQELAITIDAHAELQSQLQKLEAASARDVAARVSLERDLSQAHATVEQLLADVESLRAEAERHAAEKAGLRTRIDQQASEASALQAQLHEAREIQQQRDALAAQLESSEARSHGLESQLADARGIAQHRDQLAAQLESAGRRIAELEREVGDAHRSREEHQQHLAGNLELAGRRVDELERELADAHDVRAHRNQLASEVEASNRRVHELETELADAHAVRAHRDQLASQVDASSRRLHELEAELSIARQAREERDRFAVEAETAHRRVHELEMALADARRRGDQRATAAAEPDTAGARLQQLEAVNASQQDHIRQLTARLEDALRSEVQLQEKLAGRPAEMPQHDDADIEIMRAEVDRMVALLDASARAVTEMATAPNANDLLTELLKRLSLQFSRVALFRVKNGKLEGEQQVGFEDGAAVTKLTFPLSADSILARAATSRNIENVTGPDSLARTGLPFGGAPTAAVAVPIVVQGSTLAVVYGDDADMPDWARGPAVHDSSVGFARLLVGQVSVLLMRHTHEMKTLEELRQYAITLVQEAKEMYLADAQAGKAPELLRSRLKDNLECASQLYAYRAAMEGTAAAALLDDQIVAELEASTPFASDLATVVAEMAAGDLQITAEAS